jgi:hypothetical protein
VFCKRHSDRGPYVREERLPANRTALQVAVDDQMRLKFRCTHEPSLRSPLRGSIPVFALACVHVELFLDAGFIGRSERVCGAKLHVAVLADAEMRRFAHDSKFSLWHG